MHRPYTPVNNSASNVKSKIKRLPVIGQAFEWLSRTSRPIRIRFSRFSSPSYWDARYASGGDSGDGSYGMLAAFKASVLNSFVGGNNITSVIEFGCGDGNQVSLSQYPQYVGIDVSATAVNHCKDLFRGDSTKKFLIYSEPEVPELRADLALSLDVIYHLVEDHIYEKYMRTVFEAATRFVIIYSDNVDAPRDLLHVRHRRFSDWIDNNRRDWRLIRHVPNQFPWEPKTERGSWADFWIYQRAE